MRRGNRERLRDDEEKKKKRRDRLEIPRQPAAQVKGRPPRRARIEHSTCRSIRQLIRRHRDLVSCPAVFCASVHSQHQGKL
jgi:hypothetical protein